MGLKALSKVSIIMPVYQQRQDWFFTALDSLVAQSYPDKEVIVSGITGDPTLKWVKEFDGVKLVESCVPDPKRQINEGIKYATGDLIIQSGSDDQMLPGALARMVKVYEDNYAVMVYPDLEYCDENMNMMYVHKAPLQFDIRLLRERQIMTDCSLVSKKVLWEFALFDVALGKFAVWDMWLKIGEKYPDKIFHSGNVGWKYRRHDNALGRTGHGEEYRDRFYDKWGIEFRYRTLPPAYQAVVIQDAE